MAKKKIGRPPAEDPLKPRGIRATDGEWKSYHDAAKAQDMKLNAWIRRVLNRAARRYTRE